MWIDIIVIAALAGVIGAICFYLHRQKKQGVKCVGCPHSKNCSGHCNCNK
ncbi:MAG: hypothetical protein ACI3XI_04540 [Eubacteriales bacterium]